MIKFNKNNSGIFLLLLLLSVCNIVYGNTGAETIQRLYPIPEHGELRLDVPAEWEVTYFSPSETKPPVITFYTKDDKRNEVFQLNLSPLWDDGFKRNITAPEQIRKLVTEVGQTVIKMSDETELILHSLEGKDGEGYFFNLTDSSAGPGEYSYLTQGALSVGKILVVFSLFTHEPDTVIHKKALKMIQTAVHKFQRDV